jgi:hypothetical protein
MVQCLFCNTTLEGFPFSCKFCGKVFCSDHRLPENHNCSKKKLENSLTKEKNNSWKPRARIIHQTEDSKKEISGNVIFVGLWLLSGLLILGLHFVYFIILLSIDDFLNFLFLFIIVDVLVIGFILLFLFLEIIEVSEKETDPFESICAICVIGDLLIYLYIEFTGNFRLMNYCQIDALLCFIMVLYFALILFSTMGFWLLLLRLD